MKKNLFDVIDRKMFSVFAREDARSNYDLLSCIYDLFNGDDQRYSIPKDELIDDLTAYIKGRDFEHFQDEEGNEIYRPAREKAIAKINQFYKCKWLERDNGEISGTFDVEYMFNGDGIHLMETFKEIIKNQDRPPEYSGYFYSISGLLTDFDIKESKARLEQVFANTKRLFNSLQGLNSSIKHYINEMLNKEDMTAEEVFDLFLNKYQNQILLTVFNNLKGKDNPSKYTNKILNKLNEIRFEKFDEVSAAYIEKNSSHTLSKEEYETQVEEIKDNLDDAIRKFENVNYIVSIIDRRNAKFHTSAVSKIKFLLNTRNDVEGRLVGILQSMKNTPEDYEYENLFPIYSSRNVDEKSLYHRSPNKEKIIYLQEEMPDIDEEDILRSKEILELEILYSKQNINEYILNLIGDNPYVYGHDLNIESVDDLTKIIVSEAFKEYEDIAYKIEFIDGYFNALGFNTRDFIISRK